METYQLKIAEKCTGRSEPFLLIAAKSPHEALKVAQRNAATRAAEIWRNGRRLARVRNCGTPANPIWIVE